MEEFIDPLARVLKSLARFFSWLIWDVCLEGAAWYIGWPLCRLITLGQKPRVSIHNRAQADGITQVIVSLTSAITVLLCVGFLIP